MAKKNAKKKSATKKLTPQEQRARFVEAAKAAETASSEEFDRAFKSLNLRKDEKKTGG